jgi:hypothetical protein
VLTKRSDNVALHHKIESNSCSAEEPARDQSQILETHGNACPNWRHSADMSLSTLPRFTSARMFHAWSAYGVASVSALIAAQRRSAMRAQIVEAARENQQRDSASI